MIQLLDMSVNTRPTCATCVGFSIKFLTIQDKWIQKINQISNRSQSSFFFIKI